MIFVRMQVVTCVVVRLHATIFVQVQSGHMQWCVCLRVDITTCSTAPFNNERKVKYWAFTA